MFAIRDDDTSYWTPVSELQEVYGDYLSKGLKLSLAVIPYSVRTEYRGDRKRLYQEKECRYVYENQELVDFLRHYVREGQVEVMLHGFDHSYCICREGKNYFLDEELRKSIGDTDQLQFVPECIHKADDILKKQLKNGKQILEDTFGITVKTFVPPSNALRPKAVEIVEDMGMNISGTITSRFNRTVDFYSAKVYLQKAMWRFRGHEIPYPYVMKYKAHEELTGNTFTPSMNRKKFEESYIFCRRNCQPFVLATHYWELLSNVGLRRYFDVFLDRVCAEDDIVTVKKCFTRKR